MPIVSEDASSSGQSSASGMGSVRFSVHGYGYGSWFMVHGTMSSEKTAV